MKSVTAVLLISVAVLPLVLPQETPNLPPVSVDPMQTSRCSQQQQFSFLSTLHNAAVCGPSIGTIFSLYPSDLTALNLALANGCTQECGGMYATFLEDVCHDRFSAVSLKIACTPTDGSAAVGAYCRFALADVLDLSIIDALLSCYDYTSEVPCGEDCRAAVYDLKFHVGCCYQHIFNNTVFFTHLYEAEFVTLDEYNAVHDLNTPGHNPWIWCDIDPPKVCAAAFQKF